MLNEEDIDFDSFVDSVENGTYKPQVKQPYASSQPQATIEDDLPEEAKPEAGSIEDHPIDLEQAPVEEEKEKPIESNPHQIENQLNPGNFLKSEDVVNTSLKESSLNDIDAWYEALENGQKLPEIVDKPVEESEEYDMNYEDFLKDLEETEKNPMSDLNSFLDELPESIAYDVQMKLEDKLKKLLNSAKRDEMSAMPKDIGEYFATMSDEEKEKLVSTRELKRGDAVASRLINARTGQDLEEMANKYGSDWVIKNLYKQNEKEFKRRTKETAAELLREIYRARRQKLPWRSKNPYDEIMADPNFAIAPDSLKRQVVEKHDEWRESVRPANLIKQMLNGDFHLPNTQSYKRINLNNLDSRYLEGEIPEDSHRVNSLINQMKSYAAKRDDPASVLNDEQKDWIQYAISFHPKDVDFEAWRQIQNHDIGEKAKSWAESQIVQTAKQMKESEEAWNALSPEEKMRGIEEYCIAAEEAFAKMSQYGKDKLYEDSDISKEEVADEARIAGDDELAEKIEQYGTAGAGEKFLPDLYKAIRAEEPESGLPATQNRDVDSYWEKVPNEYDTPIDVEYTIRDDDRFDWHSLIDWNKREFRILPLIFLKDYPTPAADFKKPRSDVKAIEGTDNSLDIESESRGSTGGSRGSSAILHIPTSGSSGSLSTGSRKQPTNTRDHSPRNLGGTTGGDVSIARPTQPAIAGHHSAPLAQNGSVMSGPASGKGGSLATSHAKLPGGFANNQVLMSKLNVNLNSNLGSSKTNESGNLEIERLKAKILVDSNTWNGSNSGDKYSPYTFLITARNQIEVQKGRRGVLLDTLEPRELNEVAMIFERGQHGQE